MNASLKRRASDDFVDRALSAFRAALHKDGGGSFACQVCGAPLYKIFAKHLGVGLDARCPSCGEQAMPEMERLHLSARFGGGVLVKGEQ